MALVAQEAKAHQLWIKKNPTNEDGIEFGVDNASEFVWWRACVRGVSNNSQGQNTGWQYANGWWYYDLDSISQRVMWRVTGLENQEFVVTYWVFRSDGTWEYGPQVVVVSDQILPSASFTNIYDGQVFNQTEFNIQVASSDNLAGVEAIRIYVVVPAGLTMSGWTPSGLANQYYKEFNATSVNYDFNAPGEGAYTFTLWVKDKAGNIAYEPGGPVQIIVDLNDPPPAEETPAAPSDFDITVNGQTAILHWQDNANNEEGFLLYRNWEYLATLPANTVSYSDENLAPGDYCYRLNAFNGSLNSAVIEACTTILSPSGDYRYADSFSYPMDCDKLYRIEPDAQIPAGACYDYQPFGSLFAYNYKVHLGADLNLRGINDLGEPLHAIANALIWDIGWVSGWGKYMILRIQSYPDQYFTLTDGTKVTEIFVLYAHLDEIKVIKDNGEIISEAGIIEKETYVAKGWQIGTVGDGNGNYSPHLHFEIRINGYSQLGYGYWPVDDLTYLDYFVDPIEFIENNWTLDDMSPLKVYIHAYDRDLSRKVNVAFDPNFWWRQGRLYDGLPLASVGWANHIWLISSANDKAASWNFYLPQTGAWSVYTIIPRYYAQANNVTYRVWHDSEDIESPFYQYLDQANGNENHKVYLGTFDFYTDWQYSVDLFSQIDDSPVQDVALDTLILVYEGEIGSGGGDNPPDDPPPDPPDDGDSSSTIDINGDFNVNVNGSEFGCSVSSSEPTRVLTALINMLIIFSPTFYILLRKRFKK